MVPSSMVNSMPSADESDAFIWTELESEKRKSRNGFIIASHLIHLSHPHTHPTYPTRTTDSLLFLLILTWLLGMWRIRCVSVFCCKRKSWMTTNSRVHHTDPNWNPDCSCRYHIRVNWFHRWWPTRVPGPTAEIDRQRWPTDLNAPNSWPIGSTALYWIHDSAKEKRQIHFNWLLSVMLWRCTRWGMKHIVAEQI